MNDGRGSWWNRPKDHPVMKKRAPVRAKATKHADLLFSREDPEWKTAYNSYVSGWIAANRIRFPELRVKIRTNQNS